MDVITHYDLLIEEGNDPFRDCPKLRDYMDGWDGDSFIEALELDTEKTALEIGIGTGRLAARVAPHCNKLVGIDISSKTIERAKDNLKEFSNISLICADFESYEFAEKYDVIYSSLTFMHFENKKAVIEKIFSILKSRGVFCLSIDKSQNDYIDFKTRKLRIFPDNPENIVKIISELGMTVTSIQETAHAFIITSRKQ